MKKLIPILLCLCAAAFSQEAAVNISGGMSFAVGDGSGDMNPGLCASIEPNRMLNRFFAIGGHADYTWMSEQTGNDEIKAGFHLIDFGFVPKFVVNFGGFNSMFFELDPAVLLAIRYSKFYDSDMDTELDPYFGLTYGAGFELGNMVLGMKFKNGFTEENDMKWINLYVGFVIR